jgi:hypothetical protein
MVHLVSVCCFLALALSAPIIQAKGGRSGGSHHSGSHSSDHSTPHYRPGGHSSDSSSEAEPEPDNSPQYNQAAQKYLPQPSPFAPVVKPRQGTLAMFFMGPLVAITLLIVAIYTYRRKRREREETSMAAFATELDLIKLKKAASTGTDNNPADANLLNDGTPIDKLLRQAKASFMHFQTLNPATSANEVGNYFTAALMVESQKLLALNRSQTRISQLNHQLIKQNDNGNSWLASISFEGQMQINPTSPARPFKEIWHYSKAKQSFDPWMVYRIERL